MLIVRTLDNKMLQDTVAGVILQPFRPTLVESTSFVETRAVKNEYRGAEVEILVSNFEPNPGVSDKTLGEDWDEYKAGLAKRETPDAKAFLAGWVKSNGTKGKDADPVSDPNKIKGGQRVDNANKDGQKA